MSGDQIHAMKAAHQVVLEAASDGWVEAIPLTELAEHLLAGGTVAVKRGKECATIERLPKPPEETKSL